MEQQPSIYRVWDSLFDDWLYRKKPLSEVPVDYARLTNKTGVQKRQLWTLVGKLLHIYLLPVAGGKGRGNVQKVVPMHYAWKIGADGEAEFTENLVTPEPKQECKAPGSWTPFDGYGNG